MTNKSIDPKEPSKPKLFVLPRNPTKQIEDFVAHAKAERPAPPTDAVEHASPPSSPAEPEPVWLDDPWNGPIWSWWNAKSRADFRAADKAYRDHAAAVRRSKNPVNEPPQHADALDAESAEPRTADADSSAAKRQSATSFARKNYQTKGCLILIAAWSLGGLAYYILPAPWNLILTLPIAAILLAGLLSNLVLPLLKGGASYGHHDRDGPDADPPST